MEACHILLERPWQFDKKTLYSGLTDENTIHHKDKNFMLHPLAPYKVLENQIQMMKMRDEERKE